MNSVFLHLLTMRIFLKAIMIFIKKISTAKMNKREYDFNKVSKYNTSEIVQKLSEVIEN